MEFKKRDVFMSTILSGLFLYGWLSTIDSGQKAEVQKFIKDYQAIIAAIIASLIAIAGWFGAYLFNNKVQDRRLKNDITNTARNEITKGIREYQDWLSKADSVITLSQPSDLFEKIKILINTDTNSWNRSMEDYEILFPYAEKVRVQLQDRAIDIDRMLSIVQTNVVFFSKDEMNEIIKQARDQFSPHIQDQIALFEDLRRELQNYCLREITGNKIPPRKPRDTSVPQIIMNKEGILEIANNVVGITDWGKQLQQYKKDNGYEY